MRVWQFVPTLLPYDAVGNAVRGFHRRLRALGVDAEILVSGSGAPPGTHSVAAAAIRDDDLIVYHLASRSPEGVRLVERHPNVVLHYHNITPPALVLPWLPAEALELALARREAARIGSLARLATAVSRYNAVDLEELGARDVVVTGTIAQFADLAAEPSTGLLARLEHDHDVRGRPYDWLFVGRLTPHKQVDRLIVAFAAFRHATGHDARLTLIGRPASPSYLRHLRSLIESLRLRRRVRLVARALPPAALADHYRAASVYVSASLHEGFGLPLLEAMTFGLPVAALAAAAVPETVGDAGVLIDEPDPLAIAAGAWVAASRRDDLQLPMQARVARFANDAVFERMLAALKTVGLEVPA